MDELRLVLIAIGAVIILLIYLWGMRKQIRERLEQKRRRRSAHKPDSPQPLAPHTDTGNAAHGAPSARPPGARPAAQIETSEQEPPAPPAPDRPPADQSGRQAQADPPESTVLLTVMAREDRYFSGTAIAQACEQRGLVLNERGLWDYQAGGDGDPLFSIAHLREPGHFDPASLPSLNTPGLLLFAHLPGPDRAGVAVDRMIAVAGQLAESLDGSLCDEQRNKLSTQAMIRLRSEAATFDRRR